MNISCTHCRHQLMRFSLNGCRFIRAMFCIPFTKAVFSKGVGRLSRSLGFLFLLLGTKFLEIITTKYIITKRNGLWSEKTIDGLDGSGLLKIYALSMEDKMAAGAFGRARNYGWNVPQSTIRIYYKSLIDHDPPSLLFFLREYVTQRR